MQRLKGWFRLHGYGNGYGKNRESRNNQRMIPCARTRIRQRVRIRIRLFRSDHLCRTVGVNGWALKVLNLPPLKSRRTKGDFIQTDQILNPIDDHDVDITHFFTLTNHNKNKREKERVLTKFCRTEKPLAVVTSGNSHLVTGLQPWGPC